MRKDEFLKLLAEKGFPEPVLVTQPSNGYLGIHTHQFEVIALIVAGSINITVRDVESTYLAGDIFHLSFAEPHSESYGKSGVSYLASRKVN